ncbi:signal transduction histidine kinase/Tfp pilus assembly protein PilF [Flavobacterium arsenatis]|uniref:Oxygen sensor histidine kinase NreB n=1 Tax=Flavobacterium arsenatis TaxID=1484332 RepID=A0ABU1TSX1_9FLAO|nr:tetratricopeptide repeat protein [Flavobacterium arsenatis]MDR6968965.1 signal transduction histidine kinase/Tfp pilus assembly protein PilF [Flavobacterium arsenatis]
MSGCKKAERENNATTRVVDSLSYFFEEANDDSIPFEKRKFYNEKAFAIISKEKNDSLNRVNYFKVANRYYNMEDLEEYKQTTLQIIKKATEARDTVSLAKAYSYMSDYYINKNIPDSVYKFTYDAEKLYVKQKDNINIAKTLLNKAILQHNESDFLGSERTVFNALKSLRNVNNDELLYEAYNLLGLIYGELAEYKLAKEYYEKALKITNSSQISPENHLKAITLNNMGLLYRNQDKDKEAIDFFESALKEKNILNDRPNIYATLKDNLAYSKFKAGDYNELPGMFYEALKIKDSINGTGIVLSKIHLSEYYIFKKDSFQALKFAKEAYDLADINNEKRNILATLKQLSNVEPKKALQYSAEYYKIDDSLKLAERRIKNKFSRIEYETEELVLEKDKLVEQRKTLIYTGLGIILLGIFIYVIRSQAARNRELQLLQEQQKANEEIYQLMLNQQNKIEEVRQLEKKRIAQDLHDGILGKLFGTRLNLGTLNNQNNDEAVESRKTYIEELKIIEQEIREISHDLNSEKAAIFNNFVLMVANFIENQQSVCKAKVNFSMDPTIDWNAIDNMAKINFYRILQEAFQNINKHAEAKNVFVTFAKINSNIELNVKDDGVGFNYLKKKKGIGLSNMKTRINSSGGTMTVMSEIGSGTLLIFELPVKNPKTNIL